MKALKQFRLSIELMLAVNELDDEVVAESLDLVANRDELLGDEWFLDNLERQRRLLHALLQCPEALARYVHMVAANLLVCTGADLAAAALDNAGDGQNLLAPAIDLLSDDDCDALSESAAVLTTPDVAPELQEFAHCFTLRLENAALTSL